MKNTIDLGPYSGKYEISKTNNGYKIINFPTRVFRQGISFLKPDTDQEEKEFRTDNVNKLSINKGDSVGIFYSTDELLDDENFGWTLYGDVQFLSDGVIMHDGDEDGTGEVSQFVIDLDDENFITDSGEFSIITNTTQEYNELDKINKILGTNYIAIICSNS